MNDNYYFDYEYNYNCNINYEINHDDNYNYYDNNNNHNGSINTYNLSSPLSIVTKSNIQIKSRVSTDLSLYVSQSFFRLFTVCVIVYFFHH